MLIALIFIAAAALFYGFICWNKLNKKLISLKQEIVKIERIPAVIYLEDGSAKNIKFIKLTPEGKLFDPDAVEDEEE